MKISAYAYGTGPCCPYHGGQSRLLRKPGDGPYPLWCPLCLIHFDRDGRPHAEHTSAEGHPAQISHEEGLLEALDWYLEHK